MNQVILGIHRNNLCRRHKETQILCRPQAIRVMTATLWWSGSKRFFLQGKAGRFLCCFGITRNLRANLEEASAIIPFPLPLTIITPSLPTSPHRAGNTIIRLSSPHHHLRPLVSSLIRVPVFVLGSQLLILRPYHQVSRRIPHATRIQSTSRLPRLPSLLHNDFTIISNAISTWPSISTGRR